MEGSSPSCLGLSSSSEEKSALNQGGASASCRLTTLFYCDDASPGC